MAPNLLMTNSVKRFLIFAACCITQGAAFGQTSDSDGAVTGSERLKWFAEATVGPATLLGGAVSAGFGTLINRPSEYGTHWNGFGARYGMRLTGISTGNAMEAGLGAIWGED